MVLFQILSDLSVNTFSHISGSHKIVFLSHKTFDNQQVYTTGFEIIA